MTAYNIAVYANGLFQDAYPNPSIPYATQAQQLNQGVTTVILWSIHIHDGGELYLNDSPFVSGGQILYSTDPKSGVNPDFPQLMQALTGSGGSVSRVLISVGAWGTTSDFSAWYASQAAVAENFKALIGAYGIVGVDFDFEPTGADAYGQAQQDMIVALTKQVADLGLFATYCPYESQSFWNGCLQDLYSACGSQPVKWWNLQCYAGGTGNDPVQWAQGIADAGGTGISDPASFVIPGFAAGQGGDDPSAIEQDFAPYAGTAIAGGFLWNTGSIFDEEVSGGSGPSAYAAAIAQGLGG